MSNPASVFFRRSVFLGAVGALFLSYAAPSLAQDACILNPRVEAAYQQELALYERCRDSQECLDSRSQSVQEALVEEPGAIALHRIHQFIEQSRGEGAKAQLVAHYKEQMDTHGRSMDVYLYARLLDDPAQKQSLMERASKLDAASPWPHEALAWLARRGNEVQRAQEHLKLFLDRCPSRVESSYRRWAEMIVDSGFWLEVWGPAAQQAERAALKGSSPKLLDLWRTKLTLTEAAQHPEALAHMGKVLEDIEAQGRHDDAAWWELLQEGYGLVGDEVRQQWALAGLRNLEPCSKTVTFKAVRAFWKQSPTERPEDLAKYRRALAQQQLRTAEAWLEACPQSWPYRAFHFDALGASEKMSTQELTQLFESTRNQMDIPPDHRWEYAISMGRHSFERGILLERRDDWWSRLWDQEVQRELELASSTLTRSSNPQPSPLSGPHHDLTVLFTDSTMETLKKVLGRPLPPFELNDLEGRTWNLERLAGQVVFLDVWTSGCLPCRAAFPWIDRLHALTQKRDDLQVLTLSANRSAGDASALIREKGYRFPVMVSESYAHGELGVSGYPTTYIIDGSGTIVEALAGFGQKDGETWLAETFEKMEKVAQQSSAP